MSESADLLSEYLEDGDLTASGWLAALREKELLGQRCSRCDHVTAAPKAACGRCGCRDLSVERLPTAGEVYSETTITVPPKGFSGTYQVVLVALGDARVLGRVNRDESVVIGDAVEFEGVIEESGRPAPRFG